LNLVSTRCVNSFGMTLILMLKSTKYKPWQGYFGGRGSAAQKVQV
jgi:hypothetical protein